jgi:AraC-like DNA-binding protein
MPRRNGDAAPAALGPWFRTRSPEEAIHLCAASFYPHRLALLGPSHSFGMSQRVTRVGPITIADVTYDTDVSLGVDETRASYHVCVPLKGWLQSRHRGEELTATPELAPIYRPDAETTVTRWPAGSRHLAVKIDQCAVDRALEALLDSAPDPPIAFDGAISLHAGAAQDWVRLALMMHSQHECADSLMRHRLVWDPLVESLIHGLLLVADHPHSQALAAPAQPGPAAVRNAVDLIEAGPHLPLTTSTLAKQCHVSARTLQEGFRRHLGMSPMAYLRVVRLRCAHRDLRSANPSHSSVASIAHRWGFTHLGRFAAAHQKMFGETPLKTLRSAR